MIEGLPCTAVVSNDTVERDGLMTSLVRLEDEHLRLVVAVPDLATLRAQDYEIDVLVACDTPGTSAATYDAATQWLRRHAPDAACVLYTGSLNPALLRHLRGMGAARMVAHCDGTPERLDEALVAALLGKRYLSPAFDRILIRLATAEIGKAWRWVPLGRRQQCALRVLAAAGTPDAADAQLQAIAAGCGDAPEVTRYIEHALKHIGARSKADFHALVAEVGLEEALGSGVPVGRRVGCGVVE